MGVRGGGHVGFRGGQRVFDWGGGGESESIHAASSCPIRNFRAISRTAEPTPRQQQAETGIAFLGFPALAVVAKRHGIHAQG